MNYITLSIMFVVIFYVRYKLDKWLINYLCNKSDKYKRYFKKKNE